MNSCQSKGSTFDERWIVAGILLASLLLRGILILRGGQYYISDETRYEVSRAAAQLLVAGQPGEAFRQLAISPEHIGFKVMGVLPAFVEQITGPSLMLPALFFSLFSVLNLYLICLISRRTSSSTDEPLFALFLAACAHSLLYYARHLFPYDLSLSFGLLALYIALRVKQPSRGSLLCGALSFLCFITYNGYWSFSAFVMLANILYRREMFTKLVQKAMFTVIGFITPLVVLVFAMLGTGTNMVSAYRLFATSITQGSFGEGWRLPFEYFWHAEHTLILILTVLAMVAIIRRRREQNPVYTMWVSGTLFIYLCLVIPSVILQEFVVYGRLARQMLPSLILLSASGLAHASQINFSGHKVTVVVLALTLLQAAWNFGISYRLSFPRQLTEQLQVQFPAFEFSTKRLAYGAPTQCRSDDYVMENAKYFLSTPEEEPSIPGEILWEAPHPVNFLPYQYEGYTPEQRQEFRRKQLQMRFYKVGEQFMSETNPVWTTMKSCVTPQD